MSRPASPAVGSTVTCAETGQQFVIARDGCSFNYATNAAGEVISDAGVNIRERRELSHRNGPFPCYLSTHGDHVTGWKGNRLGTVTRTTIARSGFHGSTQYYVHVVDVHGGHWHGRGPGRGMYLTLRPCKGG